MSKKPDRRRTKELSDRDGKPGFWAWIRGRFFAGMVIAAPIAATVFATYWFVTFVDNRMKPLMRGAIPEGLRDTSIGNVLDFLISVIPGLGLVFAVLLLILIGTVGANLLGRSALQLGERILNRIPLVNSLYSMLKQIVEVVAGSNQASFREVVMVQYPKENTWAVGFITSNAAGDVALKLPDKAHVGVFVPTTPNPTSGFLIYVPEEEIIRLNFSVEEGAKLIISAGLVVPQGEPQITPATPQAPLVPKDPEAPSQLDPVPKPDRDPS